MKKILATTCLGLFSVLANAEGVMLSEKTLIREVVAGNAGQEIIVPYVSLNTAKTKLTVRFDIYPIASTTKLFSTPAHIFNLPSMDCDTNQYSSIVGWEAGIVSAPTGGANEVMSYTINRGCQSLTGGYVYQSDVAIYGANVTSSAGAKWGKLIQKTYLHQMVPVNSDADATYELMLISDTPETVAEAGTKRRVEIVNMVTGAVEVAAKDRVVKSLNLAPQKYPQ